MRILCLVIALFFGFSKVEAQTPTHYYVQVNSNKGDGVIK